MWRQKILPELKPKTFQSRVWRSNQLTIPDTHDDIFQVLINSLCSFCTSALTEPENVVGQSLDYILKTGIEKYYTTVIYDLILQ